MASEPKIDPALEARDKTTAWANTLTAEDRAVAFFREQIAAEETRISTRTANMEEAKRRDAKDPNIANDEEYIAIRRALIAGFKDAIKGGQVRAKAAREAKVKADAEEAKADAEERKKLAALAEV